MNENKGSRRQKIYDLVRTTRDVYIPTISNTITQLASEATTRAMYNGESEEASPSTDIFGANIILYPHFTRTSDDGEEFYTQVHGWVYSTEGSLRRKKLIMSLARQLIKSNNSTMADVTAGQLDEQLSSIQDNDSKSFFSTNSNSDVTAVPPSPLKRAGTASSSSTTLSSLSQRSNIDIDETLKERIAAFLNRSLGNLELKVAVGGSNRDDLETKHLLTDANGNFNVDMTTSFKPTYVQVAVHLDERIFVFKNTIYPGDSEYAIISDIDDTIKRTGVLDDKRTVFRTTFADSLSTWEVPGAADCYRYFQDQRNFSFFYVSNSPYQLYSTLIDFMKHFEFPVGSIYLKKYSGNIINSMWEPSHTRKKAPLERIIGHFKNKKFFLVGDSSEQDLEAYVDIARSHPDKILGIYLRVVSGSMSTETFKVLNEILEKRETLEPKANTTEQDLIELESGLDSDSHIAELAKQSKLKSDQVLDNSIDLEQGVENEFFAENKESKSKSSKPSQPSKPSRPSPPQLPLRRSSPTVPAKSGPPEVPRKPTNLRSHGLSPPPQQPLNEDDSGSSISSPSSPVTASISESNTESVNPPALPKRPVPPLPPKSRIPNISSPATFNSSTIPFTDESNDEWISRVLTSLITLRKVGNIKLRLFVDFSEIQQDIEDKVKSRR